MSDHRSRPAAEDDDAPSIDELLKATDWDVRLSEARERRARALAERRAVEIAPSRRPSDENRLFSRAPVPSDSGDVAQGIAVEKADVAQAAVSSEPFVDDEADPPVPLTESLPRASASGRRLGWLLGGICLGLALAAFVGFSLGILKPVSGVDPVRPSVAGGPVEAEVPLPPLDGEGAAAPIPAAPASVDHPLKSMPPPSAQPTFGFAGSSGYPDTTPRESAVPSLDPLIAARSELPTFQKLAPKGGAIDPSRFQVTLRGATDRFAALLADLSGMGFEVSGVPPAPFPVKNSEVRYFHAADADGALAIALILGIPARDYSSFRPSPEGGRLEIRLTERFPDDQDPEGPPTSSTTISPGPSD